MKRKYTKMELSYWWMQSLGMLLFVIGSSTDNKILYFIAGALFVPAIILSSIHLVKVLREEKDAKKNKNESNESKE